MSLHNGFDHNAHVKEQHRVMELNDNILSFLNKWTPTLCVIWGAFLLWVFLRCIWFDKKNLTEEQLEKRRKDNEMILRIEAQLKEKKQRERASKRTARQEYMDRKMAEKLAQEQNMENQQTSEGFRSNIQPKQQTVTRTRSKTDSREPDTEIQFSKQEPDDLQLKENFRDDLREYLLQNNINVSQVEAKAMEKIKQDISQSKSANSNTTETENGESQYSLQKNLDRIRGLHDNLMRMIAEKSSKESVTNDFVRSSKSNPNYTKKKLSSNRNLKQGSKSKYYQNFQNDKFSNDVNIIDIDNHVHADVSDGLEEETSDGSEEDSESDSQSGANINHINDRDLQQVEFGRASADSFQQGPPNDTISQYSFKGSQGHSKRSRLSESQSQSRKLPPWRRTYSGTSCSGSEEEQQAKIQYLKNRSKESKKNGSGGGGGGSKTRNLKKERLLPPLSDDSDE